MTFVTHFIISGHSMEPIFKNGSFVLVSNIPYIIKKPKIGDVIAFRISDKVYIKRIDKIKGEGYFVRGDNSKDSLDSRKIGWIAKKEIIGKVILKV